MRLEFAVEVFFSVAAARLAKGTAVSSHCELVLKAESRTADESDYLSILGKLIREYEDAHKVAAPRMTPQRALESLMDDNDLSQSELARQLEAPQSVISEFLAGKRGLSKTLVLKLSDYFKVSPELFLSSQTNQQNGA